jgi:ribosome-binding factor A
MAARSVPRLEFRLDRVSEEDEEIERMFLRIEEERDREESR